MVAVIAAFSTDAILFELFIHHYALYIFLSVKQIKLKRSYMPYFWNIYAEFAVKLRFIKSLKESAELETFYSALSCTDAIYPL